MQSKHAHNNNRLEQEKGEIERESPHRALAKEEALASGNLSEDDPVKMRAKKLKSDDGNAERRNATGGAEGVKYAATAQRERGHSKSREDDGREVEGRPTIRREEKKAHCHNCLVGRSQIPMMISIDRKCSR